MNIDSSRYNIRAIGGGLAMIRDKRTGETASARLADLPTVSGLATMSESSFDSVMAEALADGEPC